MVKSKLDKIIEDERQYVYKFAVKHNLDYNELVEFIQTHSKKRQV